MKLVLTISRIQNGWLVNVYDHPGTLGQAVYCAVWPEVEALCREVAAQRVAEEAREERVKASSRRHANHKMP